MSSRWIVVTFWVVMFQAGGFVGVAPLAAAVCGNGLCEPAGSPPESAATCAADCGSCGDGICGYPESCSTCFADCGSCSGPGCSYGSHTVWASYASPPTCATASDGDCDGISDTTENHLIEKFAPVLYHDSQEDYLPSSAEWFLDRVHMRMHHDSGCSDDQILNKGCVEATNAAGFGHKTKGGWPFCSHQSGYRYSDTLYTSGEKFFVQIPNDSSELITRLGDLTGDSWRCYGRVRQSLVQNMKWDIQYWFFYPYNGLPFGEHEGDWEHLTVTVDCNEKIHSIYFAAHNTEGDRFYPGQYSVTGGTHPLSYVARGSHANYPTAGVHDRGILPDDYHDGQGEVWDCRQNWVNVGEAGKPVNGNWWLLFGGLWGEVGTFLSGPVGPAFKTTGTASWTACESCPGSVPPVACKAVAKDPHHVAQY